MARDEGSGVAFVPSFADAMSLRWSMIGVVGISASPM
jgi:hypothetical protein